MILIAGMFVWALLAKPLMLISLGNARDAEKNQFSFKKTMKNELKTHFVIIKVMTKI